MTDPSATTKGTILLVDDEESVRGIILKILRRANYTVLEAASGDAAIELVGAHAGVIDLLITDMFMPGMRGPEVAQKLASKRAGLRVLFMSGYADQELKTGVPAGANFLNKPFSGAELAKSVEAALSGPPVS
jgi:two-component system, cell cycle sensor histidine kinase and response regulator CckA